MSGAEDLARASRRLYALGWMRGTSGNVSVVSDGGLLVTASGVDKSALESHHAIPVNDLGEPLRPGATPSAEARVHARIVDETGSSAAVHVHALSAVLAGALWPGGVPLSDIEQLKGIGRGAEGDLVTVPVVANSQDMADLSDRIVQALDLGVPAVIVADHGLYAWGDSLGQAIERTESLDWLFEHALRREALGLR